MTRSVWSVAGHPHAQLTLSALASVVCSISGSQVVSIVCSPSGLVCPRCVGFREEPQLPSGLTLPPERLGCMLGMELSIEGEVTALAEQPL
jgi:hypothetical protein